MQTNNELREKNERWRGLSPASGEKNPVVNLVTVAKRYREQTLPETEEPFQLSRTLMDRKKQ
jgi:hypothetical protein